MLFSDPVDLLMPSPLHLLLLLIGVTVMAFRARSGSCLRRSRYAWLLASAWCWLAATPVFAHWLGRQLEEQYPPLSAEADLPENPVIVVLAAGDFFERSMPGELQLNLASHRRTRMAVATWRRAGGTLIFCGRISRRESSTVAERMAVLAQDLGVPQQAVRVETESLNTYQNLRNAATLIDPGSPVVLVTSALHMPRAMAVARELGLEPVAVPADFRARSGLSWRAWLPNSGAAPLLGLVLHEWLGRAYYAVRGWT